LAEKITYIERKDRHEFGKIPVQIDRKQAVFPLVGGFFAKCTLAEMGKLRQNDS